MPQLTPDEVDFYAGSAAGELVRAAVDPLGPIERRFLAELVPAVSALLGEPVTRQHALGVALAILRNARVAPCCTPNPEGLHVVTIASSSVAVRC